MELRMEHVRNSKRKQEIRDIYTAAFSKEDRMPFGMMIGMSYLWNTDFLAFYDDTELCGFVYMATMGRQTFIMFFAVNEALRSRGYGSRILDWVAKRYPNNKIMVSIEPCEESAADIGLRQRRKCFYQRNGYEETGYYLELGGKKQEILVKNGPFSKGGFRLFFMLYSNLTMYPKIWPIQA